MDHGPVLGGYHGHLIDHQIFVQDIQGRCCACASGGRYHSARFMFQLISMNVEQPVQECLDLTGGRRVIDRAAQHNAIDLIQHGGCFFHCLVNISVHGINADMDDLSTDLFTFQDIRDFFQGSIGAAGFTAAAIDQ